MREAQKSGEETKMGKKILSLGGGVDSFAMLLDAIDRSELPDMVVFANVGSAKGDDGEWPGTLRFVREIIAPLCAEHGIEFVELTSDKFPIRGEESLLAWFESRRLMPGRTSRLCTVAAKVERIRDFLAERFNGEDLEVWIGFEAGEEKRALHDPHSKKRSADGRINRFPLIERDLCRCRCVELIRKHGFAVPRKSACVFCPFASRGDFQTLANELPEVFNRVVALEQNGRDTKSGKRIRFSGMRNGEAGPTLDKWVEKEFKPRKIACAVCGAEQRATKATGCDFLESAPCMEEMTV